MIAGTNWIRLELDSISWKEQNRRIEVLEHNPVDWIRTSSRLDSEAETPKIQIKKNPVDWMVIQATGLIVQNQTETPEFKNSRIQSTRW